MPVSPPNVGLKVDIDMCECHILSVLLRDRYYRAKVIAVEVNQLLSPPIVFQEMCATPHDGGSGSGSNPGTPHAPPTPNTTDHPDVIVGAQHSKRHANRLTFNMRNSQSADVWGCSIQAAYDVVAPYGYDLLQYDWPDAVFLRKEYASAFPCLPLDFARNFAIGFDHAKAHYRRFVWHQDDRAWAANVTALAAQAAESPVAMRATIEGIFRRYSKDFGRQHLWIELGVAPPPTAASSTPPVMATVTRLPAAIGGERLGRPVLHFHNRILNTPRDDIATL